ncbi:HAD family hydrolase [Streptomyces sp. MBT62]|uniref:HAD family hydrolase n=1 Tax=Streptomyces sp. MBT62 TaxID=2800410 RepID=UPI00190B0545|nr:HAD family phosphatase [Streptomyces sp. MBT62]MBK3569510.1 HAD family phosphatase [Streptomyces sp. MBT62]
MPDATDGRDALPRLLAGARAVLFDFDGPVCDLFGGVSTKDVAERVKEVAGQYWGRLDPDVRSCYDSHGILRALRDMYERRAAERLSPQPLELAEKIVTEQETEAVHTAVGAPDLVTLVGLLRQLPVRLVVVSNNAEGPIRSYLEQPDFRGKFEGVFGRDPDDARHMKPHPRCVERALAHLRLPASSCVVIGDQLTDLEAARTAGTGFVGYTGDEERAGDMRRAGANAVVSTHRSLIAAAGRIRASR